MKQHFRHKLFNASIFLLLLGALPACAPRADAPMKQAENGEVTSPATALGSYQSRPIFDDIIYFLLPDRFANGDITNDRANLSGDALIHGFDPENKGFYHGGDLRGVTEKLAYLEDLGVSAIWLAPVFKNKPVQFHPGGVSAGYHGYWTLDFLDIDPHFGTKADLKALVDAAHARNIKVILDIVINHSADVIKYEECHDPDQDPRERKSPCSYRSIADYPYGGQAGAAGIPLNPGFAGDAPEYQNAENFARLVNPGYAYTPYIPAGEENAKNPQWLNNPIYYHNRGESHWEGESSLNGDFAGLDDLFTEHPDVVAGFIDIFKYWITEFKIDGYRIDTVRHVNDSFWRAFVPEILNHAKDNGIPEFAIFGEAWSTEPAALARFTTEAAMPSVLDFAFQDTMRKVISKGAPASALQTLYAGDTAYAPAAQNGLKNPIFLGNHDMGRIGLFLREDNAGATAADIDARAVLGYALMYYGRGVPVVYYGDEQGFTGDGNDQNAREDMFASRVASYNDNPSIGGGTSPQSDNFNPDTPLFQKLKSMAMIRQNHAALRRGTFETIMADENQPVFTFTRQMENGPRYLIVLNASPDPQNIIFSTNHGKTATLIDGAGDITADNDTLNIRLDRLSYLVAILK